MALVHNTATMLTTNKPVGNRALTKNSLNDWQSSCWSPYRRGAQGHQVTARTTRGIHSIVSVCMYVRTHTHTLQNIMTCLLGWIAGVLFFFVSLSFTKW